MNRMARVISRSAAVCVVFGAAIFAGCKATASGDGAAGKDAKGNAPFMAGTAVAPPPVPEDALPPKKTGGFDGAKAYAHVATLVGFGPRPSGSQAILETQDYVSSQLS